jgi:hypothetical protein
MAAQAQVSGWTTLHAKRAKDDASCSRNSIAHFAPRLKKFSAKVCKHSLSGSVTHLRPTDSPLRRSSRPNRIAPKSAAAAKNEAEALGQNQTRHVRGASKSAGNFNVSIRQRLSSKVGSELSQPTRREDPATERPRDRIADEELMCSIHALEGDSL